MTDREIKIHERLMHDYVYVSNQGYEVFGVFLQGSQNYQLDYAGSDIDTKCIVLPSIGELALSKQPVSKTLILEDSSHIDVKDIRLMWQHFKKQNINYLEILFTDFSYVPSRYSDFWTAMQKIKEDVAHIDNYAAVNCLVGMILEKNAALCHPYPSLIDKIKKYGFDPKQLHHILRCKEFLDRFIEGVSYEKCLIPSDRDFLIKVKADCPYKLEQAKAVAKEIVEQAKIIKQTYFDTHSRIVNEDTCLKLDILLVDVLRHFYTNQ